METDDLLPISALEHLLYCERRSMLIHVDGVWLDNGHTTAGSLLHQRVDSGELEERPGLRVIRHLALRSLRLGLFGFADAVEFHSKQGREIPYPVEYKRGVRRVKLYDDVQLAAQAMALEEMTGEQVTEGAIFYGKTQRRRVVPIDEQLRAETFRAAQRLRELFLRREVPSAFLGRHCQDCSLRLACQPEVHHDKGALLRALRRQER
ncbi:MAG: CRISPR-associated protein Cas4 [Myxococcales bacterium]|nr:CRISPR-associated protein Cas4 [Polyangiaceae bacterium]MDW8251380.1 CRISPR-associated protein Cas4 [Myxococcales bacterium]